MDRHEANECESGTLQYVKREIRIERVSQCTPHIPRIACPQVLGTVSAGWQAHLWRRHELAALEKLPCLLVLRSVFCGERNSS